MSDVAQRRLAAIVAMDVVGYSRLMGADETGTLSALRSRRSQIIEPLIAEHGGRTVKAMGDGLLLEFPSVVAATKFALAMQNDAGRGDKEIADDRAIRYRIGVHVGDIIIEDGDIFGNGVNIAARIEPLARTGGVCLSDDAYRQVRDHINVEWEDGGEHQAKNIARPIRVWHWRNDALQSAAAAASAGQSPDLPDKPSIAVLPFDNMSGDPEQEFFADGMSEDIITALSRINSLFVIARNSTFAYKGKATDIRKIAGDLGVRYVLEGSVRKSGERLRITGQLIDAANGVHLWADKFDGSLADVFALQDQVAENVIAAIQPNLRKAEIQRSKRKRPENLHAYDLYLRALPHLYTFRPEPNAEALYLLEQAVGVQPDYAPALANLAWALEQRIVHHWPGAKPADRDRAIDLARQAISADRNDADTTSLSGFLLTILGRDHESGLRSVERALEINPNSAVVCMGLPVLRRS
jgi:TolB-like protein